MNYRTLLLPIGSLLLFLAMWSCSHSTEEPLELAYPVEYLLSGQGRGGTDYFVVGQSGYSPASPSLFFQDVVQDLLYDSWEELVLPDFPAQFTLLSPTEGSFSITNDEGEIIRSDTIVLFQSEESVMFGDIFLLEFEADKSKLSFCEISACLAFQNQGQTNYLSRSGELCSKFEGEDLTVALIESFGLQPGDTIAIVQSQLIYERQE